MGCQVEIADKIVAHKADYLLALKGDQPTLEADLEDYFRTAPAAETVTKTTSRKAMAASKRAPIRLPALSTGSSAIEATRGSRALRTSRRRSRSMPAPNTSIDAASTHATISLRRPSTSSAIARGTRSHWGLESMHWLLDVKFKDELSRYRTGHGAKNMAIIRRVALGLVRADKSKGRVKTRRKTASWSPDFLLQILQLNWTSTWIPCHDLVRFG
jgi:predicted transposase YbfD/YdcC